MLKEVARYVAKLAYFVLVLCELFGTVGAQLIKVQLIDGRNGKPIKNARVYIAFDNARNADPLDLRSDKQGEVAFETHGHRTMEITGVGEIGCGVHREYPIDIILNTGFSTWNNCGNVKLEPEPGRLYYFVRSATWWELFKN